MQTKNKLEGTSKDVCQQAFRLLLQRDRINRQSGATLEWWKSKQGQEELTFATAIQEAMEILRGPDNKCEAKLRPPKENPTSHDLMFEN